MSKVGQWMMRARSGMAGSEWMTVRHETLRNKSVLQLAIPGSHDSGMYKPGLGRVLGPDTEPEVVQIFAKVASLPLIHRLASSVTRDVIARWSRTQSLDLVSQLDRGIRYLDLRIAYVEGDFHATHTLMKEESVFADLGKLQAWCLAHPQELLILDFQHFYALDDAAHATFCDRLMQCFRNAAGESMLVARSSMHAPIGEYLDRGQQVIILYGDDCRVPATGVVGQGSTSVLAAHADLWPRGECINSVWVNKRQVHDLIPALSQIVTQRAAAAAATAETTEDRLWVLQGVLTADAEDIKRHPQWTLKKFGAESCNATLAQQVPQYFVGSQQKGWIIIMDFVEVGGWIERVISAND